MVRKAQLNGYSLSDRGLIQLALLPCQVPPCLVHLRPTQYHLPWGVDGDGGVYLTQTPFSCVLHEKPLG